MRIIFTLLVLFLLNGCSSNDNKKIKTFELEKLDIAMPSLSTHANYGNYGGKLSIIENNELKFYLAMIFDNQTPKKLLINEDFYYISTTTKGGSGTEYLNENALIVKYNHKTNKVVKKIDYISTKSFNDIEFYNKKIHAIDLSGILYITDESTKKLQRVNSSLKFLNFLNSIDGNFYVHTINKIYKVKDKKLIDIGLTFNAINSMVEDKISSYWYIYADDNLFKIR